MIGRVTVFLAAALFASALAAQESPWANAPLPPPRPANLAPVDPVGDPPQPPPPRPAAADDAIAASDVIDEELASASARRRPEFDRNAALACEQALRAIGGRFDIVEPIGKDDAHCGAPRGLRLSEAAGVRLEPAIETRCPVALALAKWTRDVVKPMARLYLDDEPVAMMTVGDYDCRWTRGGQGSPSFSQHAFANAVDIGGVSFAGRAPVAIAPPPARAGRENLFQAAIRGGACVYFTTVLGPMTNAAHVDHFHFDMAERGGGFRMCQ
ncbi:MAG: hypothetical protein EA385_14300 [Salinarimonadaceae bacterium]|nr:MAG: hypothetical protein EA385_14300 [Salinarimonadaceae bacterium]